MQTSSQLPQALFSNTQQKQSESAVASTPTSRPDPQPDLRSVVASRFMRMLRWHDRARNELLATPPAPPR